MKQRDKIGSRLGFIMLSAGCAIGCGNVWKFPWMTGQNGGGCFVFFYIIFLLLIGTPVLIMEFAIGRRAQSSPVTMYRKIEKPGQKWHIHGGFMLAGNVALMAFYTVVCGWMIYYFINFVTGSGAELSFGSMTASPKINISFLAVTVIVAFFILSFDISKGLEKITKYMMLILIAIMILLAIRGFTLPGAAEGLKFYLLPDFSKINPQMIVAALNQGFFTLSIGMGSMAIFGSYINKERSLMGEALTVISLDTFVALMAGLIIFPVCYTYKIEVIGGPSLLFDSMATAFNNMPGGRVLGSLFFLFMTFAALSTVLTVCENIVSCVMELTGISRPKSAVICGIGVFLLSLTTALGFSVFKFAPFGEGSTWMNFWDFIVSQNLLPLGAIVITVFCTSKRFGWGWDNFVKEANEGKGLRLKPWMRPVFKYVIPAVVLFIYIYGLITFKWQ